MALLPGCLPLRVEEDEAVATGAVLQDVGDFAAAAPLPVWSRQSKTEKAWVCAGQRRGKQDSLRYICGR
jgi:hypothetical protein